MPSSLFRTIGLFFAIPLAMLSIVLAWGAIVDTYHSQAAKFWHPHEAIVDSVRLGHSKNSRLNSQSRMVYVNYSYLIENQKYSSDQIAYGYFGSNFMDDNRPIYKLLKEAQTIRVYVNPEDPKESVMATGFNVFILWFYLPISVVLLVICFKTIKQKLVFGFIFFTVLAVFFVFSGSTISKEIVVLKKRNADQ